jgi:hypothetical protein
MNENLADDTKIRASAQQPFCADIRMNNSRIFQPTCK